MSRVRASAFVVALVALNASRLSYFKIQIVLVGIAPAPCYSIYTPNADLVCIYTECGSLVVDSWTAGSIR